MSLENAEKFEQLLREDEALQAKFAAASKEYEGEQADEAMFEALIVPIAAGVGLPFTLEDALAFASRDRELNDAELDAVAGGTSLCYFVGGGSEPDAGTSSEETGGACAYIGVSMAVWD